MKKLFTLIVLALATSFLIACSSDDCPVGQHEVELPDGTKTCVPD